MTERFNLENNGYDGLMIVHTPDGDYVEYEEAVAPLLKRIEELEKEALLTDSAIQFLIDEVKPQHKETNKASDAQCPVCGYYCLGNGGNGCIDKPSICLGGTEK